MKKFFAVSLIALSFNALADIQTQVEFTSTINCLVANATDNDIRISRVFYYVNTTVGPRTVTRECTENCVAPAGLIARFFGPSITNLVQSASCEIEYEQR